MNKYLLILIAGLAFTACSTKNQDDQAPAEHGAHHDTSHANHSNPKNASIEIPDSKENGIVSATTIPLPTHLF